MFRSSNPTDIFKHIQKSLERDVDRLMTDINTDAERDTPRKTGRAARGWRYTPRYRLGYAGHIIENKVSYIGILEQGYSRQAPNGMLKPAINSNIRRRRKI